MASRGITFFTDWTSPLPLLAVALHSLEKFYQGEIHVLYGENTPPFFIEELKQNKRIGASLFILPYEKVEWVNAVWRKCWYLKPIIHKSAPFDLNMVYDCDHVFVGDFDESIFDLDQKWIQRNRQIGRAHV